MSIWSDILGIFDGNDLKNWLASMGGSIASGLEIGIDSIFQDFWNVVIGPFEVITGIVIMIIALVFAFKDDLMQLAPLIAMAAA
jgi:hypothetical protein